MRTQSKKQIVTQRQIAIDAGVSVNTVCRALNNKQDVNVHTKQRIIRIAKKLSYTPNLIARSLKVGETKTIGVLVSDITNPFFGAVVQAIEKRAQKKGYSVLFCNSDENYKREERAIKVLVQKRVDGVLLTPVGKKTTDLLYLQEMGIAFVLVARRTQSPDFSYVVADDVLGSFLATEHLIKKRHKRILYIAGPRHVTTARERLDGYKEALARYRITFKEELVRFTNTKLNDGYKVMKDAISEKLDFTAVSTFNDYLALGVMKAAYEQGLRIPHDVAIMGYDDIEYASIGAISLSTVSIPKYEIGYRAMELLLSHLSKEHSRSRPQQVTVKPELVIRTSA